ncbi:MAG TPA: NADH-quinone oxidoreductase subunit L [Gemmatimonadaceae bacterium]|nr:NADH-quinone oxidoreductase subunit L [Gemmatimonadaceae bacterium]
MVLQLAAESATHPLAGTAAQWMWALPLLPLLGFVINGLLSLAHGWRAGPADPFTEGHTGHEPDEHAIQHAERSGGHGDDSHAIVPHPFAAVTSLVGPLVMILAFGLAAWIFWDMLQAAPAAAPYIQTYYVWMPAGDLQVNAAFQLDQLSIAIVLVVTGVGMLIHLFSVGYMREDPGYPRYFAYLNLFVFFMLVLVLGANYPVMFVGWEGVGLCSYLLIGFWFSEKANADAGKKAFIVNRIGDFGFLIAMFLLFANFGVLDFAALQEAVSGIPAGSVLLTTICLFFFLGCTGKSAQIPLYVWLPDAMAGPTPVSALIHAATMVTAGVYLIARSAFLFALSPVASLTVALIGALTALFAATIGLKQWDIKRVLAYSTVSQLGYMFIGVGVGAYVAGVFHLITHAFLKALLFLGSGAVIYAMHRSYHHTGRHHEDAQDMRNMGGLRRYMPVTWVVMWIGTLAIAGIPFFAGFFSKDEILAGVFARAHDSILAEASFAGIPGSILLYAIFGMGLLAALLTAVYMTRMMLYTFHGPNRTGEGERPHLAEAPFVMVLPLVVLALLSAFGGFLNVPPVFDFLPVSGHLLGDWLDPVVGQPALLITHGAAPHLSHATEYALIGGAVAIAIVGILLAIIVLRPSRLLPKTEAPAERGIQRVLLDKYYVDEGYDRALVDPTVRLSRNVLWRGIDVGIIDGLLVNGSALLARGIGWLGSRLQTGQTGTYAWVLVIGVLAVLGAFTFR